MAMAKNVMYCVPEECNISSCRWRKILQHLETLSCMVLNNKMIRCHVMQNVAIFENGCPLVWDFWERQVMAEVNGEDPSSAGKDSAGTSGEQELARRLVGKGKNSPGCSRSFFFFFSFSFLLHQVLPGVALQPLALSQTGWRLHFMLLKAYLFKKAFCFSAFLSEWRTEIQNCLRNCIVIRQLTP